MKLLQAAVLLGCVVAIAKASCSVGIGNRKLTCSSCQSFSGDQDSSTDPEDNSPASGKS